MAVPPKAAQFSCLFLLVIALAGGCTSVDYTDSISGTSALVVPKVKDFQVLGMVQVFKTETHSAEPLGFLKSIEGSKVTYSDLMREAALLEADDIIDVRIDAAVSGKITLIDWLKGWTKTITYTGTAIAIRYDIAPAYTDIYQEMEWYRR
jgi:hypothetical protein